MEFRFGNGTTHAGEARTMAVFCLAMVAKAKLAKAASGRNPREYNETRVLQNCPPGGNHNCRGSG